MIYFIFLAILYSSILRSIIIYIGISIYANEIKNTKDSDALEIMYV